MKLAILCGSNLALPALSHLIQQRRVIAVGVPNKQDETIVHIGMMCHNAQIPFQRLEKAELKDWLLKHQPDCVWIKTFPIIIPAELLTIPPKGIFNFHYARLPQYRGPSPLFWQLSQGETEGGISVHKIDAGIDTGPIAFNHSVPIMAYETYGMHLNRLAGAGIQASDRLWDLIQNDKLELNPQDQSQAHYYPRPQGKDVMIDWSTLSRDQVVALVKATNPWNFGAYTALGSWRFRILEVTPADGPDFPEAKAGEIVLVDPAQGVFAICSDRKLLRIDIVFMEEGVLTGNQWMNFGIKAGDVMM